MPVSAFNFQFRRTTKFLSRGLSGLSLSTVEAEGYFPELQCLSRIETTSHNQRPGIFTTITADIACSWQKISISTIWSDHLDCADPNDEIGSSVAVRPECRPELPGH